MKANNKKDKKLQKGGDFFYTFIIIFFIMVAVGLFIIIKANSNLFDTMSNQPKLSSFDCKKSLQTAQDQITTNQGIIKSLLTSLSNLTSSKKPEYQMSAYGPIMGQPGQSGQVMGQTPVRLPYA